MELFSARLSSFWKEGTARGSGEGGLCTSQGVLSVPLVDHATASSSLRKATSSANEGTAPVSAVTQPALAQAPAVPSVMVRTMGKQGKVPLDSMGEEQLQLLLCLFSIWLLAPPTPTLVAPLLPQSPYVCSSLSPSSSTLW